MSPPKVGRFFDSLTEDYTATIERCFPRYREMLWAVLDYIPAEFKPHSILELGTGTGNLSVLIRQRFPDAELTLVDLSADSLEVCRQRLKNDDQVNYKECNFADLEFDPNSFDLIVSSISIHHLETNEKRHLFKQMAGWLNEQGILSFADQCAGVTDEVYQRHIENWRQESFAAGSTEAEWQMWMDHQQAHDHHDPLCDQLEWLQEAGFRSVDCTWRYLLWSVVHAVR